MRNLLTAALVATLALSNTGCIKSMIMNGQIEATRKASSVVDTIGDYDLARGASEGGIVQFEGMHKLAPDNEDALFMLAQSWVGYGFAFAEDDMEAAMDAGNDDLADYHHKRARMAYDRAVFYGLELLSHTDKGLDAAKKNKDTMKAWLTKNFTSTDDAQNLFWAGYAWMARINLEKDDPAMVADLFVGESMVERAVELDPSYNHWTGVVALAAYHARAGLAEPEEGKKLFEMALAKTERKDLIVQFTYAQTYACIAPNRELYDKLLKEVLDAGDTDPEQRLENAIAKRKARRYQSKTRLEACGFDTSPPAAAAPAPAKESAPAPASAPAAASTSPAASASGTGGGASPAAAPAGTKPGTAAPAPGAKPAAPAPAKPATPAPTKAPAAAKK